MLIQKYNFKWQTTRMHYLRKNIIDNVFLLILHRRQGGYTV